MGGYFGIVSKNECLSDVFFGVDYHSHLGTRSGGLVAYNTEKGLQRSIHNLDNAPFRTKFEGELVKMRGTSAIGCINDSDPQPLLIRSNLGVYAICMVGKINNCDELEKQYLTFSGGHFNSQSGGAVNTTELVAALIDQKSSFGEGIRFAQDQIDGTASILILTNEGNIIAARDKMGRLPVIIGKRDDGYAISFETFAFEKNGYVYERDLGPGEVVELTPDSMTMLMKPLKKKRICSFLWSYYGYPTSTYEGMNVELMRYRNGAIMAMTDDVNGVATDLDYVGGVPDSGTPHAIGYANQRRVDFARAFIKYTPTWSRSFMPPTQKDRDRIAHMKQIPVKELIEGKNLLFVDDSIVRGTQLRETVEFLYANGAKAVHMRSACPPIMFGCKYLNFSRSVSEMELIGRRVIDQLEGEEGLKHLDEYMDGTSERGKKMRQAICDQFKFASLDFQSLEGVIEAIGLEPCELCTYCWNGKE